MSRQGLPSTLQSKGGISSASTVQRGPAYSRERFSVESVQDPAALARQLAAVQTNIDKATAPVRANPLLASGGQLIRGIIIGAGLTFAQPHKLGRAFVGWFVTAVAGVARSSITEGAFPDGVTAKQSVPIQNTGGATATVDVYVF